MAAATLGDRDVAAKLDLPDVPGPELDWSSLDGIDPKVADALGQLGIKNIEQLEALSSEEREVVEAKLSFEGHQWDWGQLEQWKSSVAARAAAVVGERNAALSSGARPGSIDGGWIRRSMFGGQLDSPPNRGATVSSMAFASRPSLPDGATVTDWSCVSGVEPKLASELKSLGFQSVDQLETLSDADRSKLQAHLSEKGIEWDWGWLSGWKTAVATGTAAAALGHTNQADSNAATSSDSELSSIDGVDAALASELGSLGIKSVDQLEQLSPEDRETLQSRLSEKGHTWDWGWLPGWKTAAAGAAAVGLGAVGASNASSDDTENSGQANQNAAGDASSAATSSNELSRINGVDPGLTNELAALGITSVDQLEKLSPEDRQTLQSKLSGKGHQWDWSWVPDWKSAAASEASVADEPRSTEQTVANSESDGRNRSGWGKPTHAYKEPQSTDSQSNSTSKERDHSGGSDVGSGHVAGELNLPESSGPAVNWSALEGVHPKLADELEALGVQSLDQLEHLPYQDRIALESRLKAKGIDWDWAWLKNWRSATFGTAPVTGFASGTGSASANQTTQSLSGLAGQQHDPNQLPVFASGVPTIKDDLTLLDGIDGPQAIELHKMGIHNFDQLHDLSAENRIRLQNWFRKRGWFLGHGSVANRFRRKHAEPFHRGHSKESLRSLLPSARPWAWWWRTHRLGASRVGAAWKPNFWLRCSTPRR